MCKTIFKTHHGIYFYRFEEKLFIEKKKRKEKQKKKSTNCSILNETKRQALNICRKRNNKCERIYGKVIFKFSR